MLRNKLQKFRKKNPISFNLLSNKKNEEVIQTLITDYKSKDWNTRISKYRSFKGVFGNR